jgi:hypothetical protein
MGLLCVGALLILFGCTGRVESTGPDDAGEDVDSGAGADAGHEPDAGVHADASSPSDAGTTFDSGTREDAGSEPDSGAIFNPPFPRLGAYSIGSPQTYDATFRGIAAKYHLVIVSNWQGYSGDLPNMAAVFKAIKNQSTVGTKLFCYVNDNETEPWMEATELNKVKAQSWYLYPQGTSGTPVPSAYAGATEVNNTVFTKPDANGKIWIDWYADFRYAAFVAGDSLDAPNPYGDGFFMDNVFWEPDVDGDWNLDGVTDSHTDPTVQGWYRAGYQHYFQYMQTIWPGSVQLGNVAEWGQSNATLGVYDQMIVGGVLEGYLGDTWSFETWGGFDVMMTAYRTTMNAFAPPKLGIIGDDGAATDYQGMRYGLGATLMDDAYYYHSYGGGYQPPPLWYDEFNFNLGYPSNSAQGARQSAAWSQGVWRRDFDNGIVLVNPKGNGPQTINLGGTFKKLTGTQDPTVNDGSTVTSVSLLDRDGIILSR